MSIEHLEKAPKYHWLLCFPYFQQIFDCFTPLGLTNVMLSVKCSTIFEAVEMDNIEAIDSLLNSGENIEKTDKCGKTALMLACDSSCTKMNLVEILLKNGANPNAKDSKGNTSLMFTAKHCGNGSTLKVIKTLIAYGADVNAVNDSKENCLHFVTNSCNRFTNAEINVVNELLKQGVNINAVNDKGETPFYYLSGVEIVSGDENEGFFKTLFEIYGADATIRSKNGSTPFLKASQNSIDNARLKLFLTYGSDVNECNENNGNTALMDACGTINATGRIEFLLGIDACEMNAINKNGETAVEILCSSYGDNVKGLEILWNYGVALDKLSQSNLLLIAIKSGNCQIAKWLISNAGADINEINDEGKSALDVAIACDKYELKAAWANSVDEIDEFVELFENLYLLGNQISVEFLEILFKNYMNHTVEYTMQRIFPIDKTGNLMKSTFLTSTTGKISRKTKNRILLMRELSKNDNLLRYFGKDSLAIELFFSIFSPEFTELRFVGAILENFKGFRRLLMSYYDGDDHWDGSDDEGEEGEQTFFDENEPELNSFEAMARLCSISKLIINYPMEALSTNNLLSILSCMEKRKLCYFYKVSGEKIKINLDKNQLSSILDGLELDEQVFEKMVSVICLLASSRNDIFLEISSEC